MDWIGIGSVCIEEQSTISAGFGTSFWNKVAANFYRNGEVNEEFQDQYDRLLDIRNQLDRLSVTQAWSLRETDLFGYQKKLDRIDEARVDGSFVTAQGQPADSYTQRVGLSAIRLQLIYSLTDMFAFFFRPCYILYDAATHTYMHYSSRRNLYQRHCCLYTTSCRRSVDAWWKSKSPGACQHRASFIPIAWR